MKKVLVILSVLFVGVSAHAAVSTAQPVAVPFSITVASAPAAANTVSAVTVSTPTGSGTYSSGYYNYITNIHIEMYATGTLTGGSTPVTCTTTNLPGNPVFKFQTAEATGTEQVTDVRFVNPLQATQASQVVVSCPATASVIWNVIVGAFSGQ